MDEEYKKLRSNLLQDGKNYKENVKAIRNFRRKYPDIDISESMMDDYDDLYGKTESIEVFSAYNQVNSLKKALKKVEKSHGKMARQCMEDFLINGESQKSIGEKQNLGKLRTVKTYFQEWIKSAIEKK